jgi:urea transport system substrate-binding protein
VLFIALATVSLIVNGILFLDARKNAERRRSEAESGQPNAETQKALAGPGPVAPEGPPLRIAPEGPPLRIGVLHSRTGTMAISERPVIDAVSLAVDDLNEQGGVLGRPVEAVVRDGHSDETVFAREAERLITQDQVVALFGCWTSASRKAVKSVVERHDHLLFYPVQYEGMEMSPNIVYGGPVPNQQILPALKWSFAFLNKKRWFLVGSDYIYPRAANAVIRDEAKSLGSQIVGEQYLPLGSTETDDVVRAIGESKPDLILNTINGDTNVAFFRRLRRAGGARIPALSFSISEQELSNLAPRELEGDYTAGSYFESIDLPQNQAFLQRFQARYGGERAVSDPMQTAYYSVFLWAQVVRAAGRADVRAVREAIKGQRFDAPQGTVEIDAATLHTVQQVRIGRVNPAGRLEEVFVSPRPIAPEPFPRSRSRAEWGTFLEALYNQWGGHWANPGH